MKKSGRFLAAIKLNTMISLCSMLLLLLIVTGCLPGVVEPPPPPVVHPLVLVAGDATLQVFDTGREEWREPVGLGLGANWITLYNYSDMVVVNSISHNLQQFEYETDGWRQIASIDLGLEQNTSPYAATMFDNGVAVTNLLANSVSIVDLNEGRIVNQWPVGVAPEGILASNDTLYVINTGYDFNDFSFHTGSVYKMLATTGEILDTLALGVNPQFGATKLNEIHIVCTGDYQDITGEVWILDQSTLELKEILDIGHSPGRIVIETYQREFTAFIAAGGWSNQGASEGLILSYNVETREIYEPLSANLGVVDVAVYNNSLPNRLYAVCRDAMKMDVFEGHERVASYDLVDPPNAISIIN